MSQHLPLPLSRFSQVLRRAPTANHPLSSARSKTAVTAPCHLPIVRHQMTTSVTKDTPADTNQAHLKPPLPNVISAAFPLSRQRALVITACRRTLFLSRSLSTASTVSSKDLQSRSPSTVNTPLLSDLQSRSSSTVSKLSTSSLKSHSPKITNGLPLLRLQFHNLDSTSRLHLSKSCSLDVTNRMPSLMIRFRSLPRHQLSATVLSTLKPLRQSRKSVNAKNLPSMPNQTLSITATTTASSLLQRNTIPMSRSLAPILRRLTRLHPHQRHLEKPILHPSHLTRCRLSQLVIRSFQILLHLSRRLRTRL
jgi:hypothetical protein